MSWLICSALGIGLVVLAFVRGASRHNAQLPKPDEKELLASHIAANSDTEGLR